MTRWRDPDPFAVAAMLATDILDRDIGNAHTMWRALTPDLQYRVVVVLACQLPHPDLITLDDLRRRVDRVVEGNTRT